MKVKMVGIGELLFISLHFCLLNQSVDAITLFQAIATKVKKLDPGKTRPVEEPYELLSSVVVKTSSRAKPTAPPALVNGDSQVVKAFGVIARKSVWPFVVVVLVAVFAIAVGVLIYCLYKKMQRSNRPKRNKRSQRKSGNKKMNRRQSYSDGKVDEKHRRHKRETAEDEHSQETKNLTESLLSSRQS